MKEKRCLKSLEVNTFWIWRSASIELILSSGKHASVFCSFWRAVLNDTKKMIFRQNKIYTFSFCSKVYTPALNAWFFLLDVKRWTSNHSYCWKGFTYTRDAGKPKNMWDLKDFSEEQAVELFRTNKGLINNYKKNNNNNNCGSSR